MRRSTGAMRTLRVWIIRLVAGFVSVSLAAVIAYSFFDPPLTPLMVIRVVEGRAAHRRVGVTKRWVDIERVSPTLVRAVLAAEDGHFFRHHGVDLDALRRALAYNARHRGRRLRGAGTITMQCARNVFLWQGRSYVRKALEVYFAPLLELTWGKRRILEVYLNVIEWGDGVYGVEAAAERYFGVSAAELDARQSALLAAALPDPRRSNPAAPSRYLAARAAIIVARAERLRLEPAAERTGAGRGRSIWKNWYPWGSPAAP
jgi:monofunctional biosynthetic peptidoglycan transglycosylase